MGCEMSIRREGSMVQVQFDARLDEEAAEHALTVRPSFQRAFGLDSYEKSGYAERSLGCRHECSYICSELWLSLCLTRESGKWEQL